MPRARTLIALLLLLSVAAPAPAGAQDADATDAPDEAAPALASAVGISRSKVRLRFSEPIQERQIVLGDVALSMGGTPRTTKQVTVAADGLTAVIKASPKWEFGTAGSVRLSGTLTDARGNASRARRDPVRVWASPGDVTLPVLSNVRLAQKSVCIVRVSPRTCRASGGSVRYRVDEAVTIVLDVRRRSNDAPSLLKFGRVAGPGIVSFREKIEGFRLRPGAFLLTVYAVDAAGNASRATTLRLRVRRR